MSVREVNVRIANGRAVDSVALLERDLRDADAEAVAAYYVALCPRGRALARELFDPVSCPRSCPQPCAYCARVGAVLARLGK